MAEPLDSGARAKTHADQKSGDVYEQAYTWLQPLRSSPGFRSLAGPEPGLMDTCCGILILEGLGKLLGISQEERAAWGSYLQGCQKADSGLFVDPLWPDSSINNSQSTCFTYQMTHLALQALNALEMRAPYPLRFMDKYNSMKTITAWLEALDGSKGRLQLDEMTYVLAFLIYQAEIERDRSAAARFHTLLDWLDGVQDAQTGLWGIQEGLTFYQAVVVTGRLIPFYEYVRRPITRMTYIVDTMLRSQQADGSLGGLPGDSARQDLAAIDVLAVSTRHAGYRQDDIKRALIHSYRTIREMQNKDGSFMDVPYNNIAENRAKSSQASPDIELFGNPMVATWFRLAALAIIEHRYPDDLPRNGRWNFRRWPGSGYHLTGDSLSEYERQVLPLWLRPLSQAAPLAKQTADEPPVVSVVTPCYNLGRYLSETISSVLAQTMQAFEMIIVNDGSTDEFTRLLLDHLDHPKIRVIHQANQGQAAALNAGIRQARGRYICSLDADDRLRPEYLEKTSAVLETQPEVGLVTSHFQMFDNREGVTQPTCTLPEILVYNQTSSASLFRRDAWEKVAGYATSLSGFQDWNMWISILELGYQAEVIPEVLLEYRVRPDSLYHGTNSRPENFARLLGEIARLHQETYRKYIVEVMAVTGYQMAHLVQLYKELSWWIKEQEWAKSWLEEQVANWQQEAEKRGQVIQEQPAWSGELKPGKEKVEGRGSNPQHPVNDLMANSINLDFTNTPVSSRRPCFGYTLANPTTPPYVTIVTPFHNTGPIFHETARSVLRQSFQQWEWLIVNDSSTDQESLATLETYRHSDPRIRVIDHPTNQGPGAARNTGFQAAQAQYVVQLDSDNLLEPTAIEKWFWFLESYPEYAFTKGFTVGFGAQQYLWKKGFHYGKAFLADNQLDTTSIVRKSVHHAAGGYDETNRDGLEDWDFWLRCASLGYWGSTIPEYLDWYRRRPTHIDRWQNWDGGKNQQAFRAKLRQRYPHLWKGGFPQIQPRLHNSNEAIPKELPCENRLGKEKPRLLMLVPWLTMGGADKFNLDLLQQLSEQGWEVTIATTLEGDHSWLPHFARYTPDIFILHHFLRLVDYPRFLRYLIQSRQVDIVLISNSELSYLLLPYLRAHFPQVTFVDFCHIEEEYWKNGGYPRMAVEHQELFDLNIVASEHLKRWMVRQGADPDRIAVSYINIDPEEWHPDARQRIVLRQELNLNNETPVILYAARICAQKQPRVFAQALLQLHRQGLDFAALVAGDGPDLDWLRSFVKKHGLNDRVNFLGATPNQRVKQLMTASDIFFLPSQWEGIALSIYEAMACSLPIVGADVGGQRELVTPECGILIAPGNEGAEAQQYAQVLAQLIRDPQRRQKMGEAGRLRISTFFRIEEMGKRMVRLFAQASEFHRIQPRPCPSLGLGDVCAAQAVEYIRLSQFADKLWTDHNNGSPVGTLHNGTRNWRAQLYLALYRWHEPYYHWYTKRGWTWLSPVRDKIKQVLLHQM